MSVSASDATTVRLHRLTMVPDHDGVTIGRPDIASYAVFPEEGAQVLRMLDSGVTVSEVAAWYERTCGESLDMEDFLAALEDLGFLRREGEADADPPPVRWQRLGRWTFSRPAWAVYLAVTAAAIAQMVRRPALRPSYHDMFFTQHLALIPLTLTVTQIPCILLHEGFHALSGRRLGLPSTLHIGRRLYYLVAETRLDSLFSVPRRRRYLPFLAGMLADVVAVSVLTLLSSLLAHSSAPAWVPALLLAVAFTCVMRLVWQLMFYLETDLYFVLTNALRCSELQKATRFYVRTRWRRLLHRAPPHTDEEWSERDAVMARRYAPVLIAGYGFSLGSLIWAGIPTTVRFWTLIADRFQGPGTPTSGIVDALTFILLTLLQFALLAYVTVRDRRERRAAATATATVTE